LNSNNSRVLTSSVALVALALFGSIAAAQAVADFDLPAQPLAESLRAIAAKTNSNILFDRSLVAGLSAPPFKAHMTAADALKKLLSNTGLTYRVLDDKTVTILPVAPPSSRGEGAVPAVPGENFSVQQEKAKGSFWDRFRLAQLDQGKTTSDSTSADQVTNDSSRQNERNPPVKLEEVLVTAEKRSERLQDVPVPVTAINAGTLLESNQFQLLDYYTRIPGLSVTIDDFRGAPTVSIRGIVTGVNSNPSVGITVDDVPYGSSTTLGGGSLVPDLDPSDLARVEVLRGPQGTLYGVSSIGGLIKYVTIDPSTDAVTGRVQAGGTSVHNGDYPGYDVRAAVNVPLSDTVAVRASGFTRRDSGYIDDPALHVDGVNWAVADGARLSGLWKPSEKFSLKLGATFQHLQTHASPEVNLLPGLKDLQQISLFRDVGGYKRDNQVYTANIKADLGTGIALAAVSAYSINHFVHTYDATNFYGTLQEDYFRVPGVLYYEDNETGKFTQEIRLSASVGERFDWLAGVFYTHESTQYQQNNIAADPASPASAVHVIDNSFPTTFEEYAAFADLTFHLTDQIDVQIGGRESQNEQAYSKLTAGAFVPLFYGVPSPDITPESTSKDNSFTYLLTPRLKLSKDFMLYARFASGYRAGGPNTGNPPLGLPAGYRPDKTRNYELGAKGDFLGHALTFDTSLYYIDWKDIQLSFVEGGFGYTANGSRAKSQGVELSMEVRPLQSLTLAGWFAYNDAKLTEPLPPGSILFGASGDRLPYSSRVSGNISLDQEFLLGNSLYGFVGGSASYVGNVVGIFSSASPKRQNFPAYTKTELRGGVRSDSWTLSLFVNNVTDKRAPIMGGVGTTVPTTFFYIQPRTVGLSISKTF
jgi:iron complex outermembrane receptor protein